MAGHVSTAHHRAQQTSTTKQRENTTATTGTLSAMVERSRKAHLTTHRTRRGWRSSRSASACRRPSCLPPPSGALPGHGRCAWSRTCATKLRLLFLPSVRGRAVMQRAQDPAAGSCPRGAQHLHRCKRNSAMGRMQSCEQVRWEQSLTRQCAPQPMHHASAQFQPSARHEKGPPACVHTRARPGAADGRWA